MCSKLSSAVMIAVLLSKTSLFQQPSAPPGTANATTSNQSRSGLNQAAGNQGINTQSFGGIGESPWFSNNQVREHLRLPDDQYNRLNTQYRTYYDRYQQDLNRLNQEQMTPAQLQARQRELEQRFDTDFSTATNDVFADENARNRYQQLQRQYRGYNSFSDPQIRQRLSLTDQQEQKLNKMRSDWSENMSRLGTAYPTDPDRSRQDYLKMQNTHRDQLNGLFNEEQRSTWREMAGDPFDFPAESYFGGTTRPGATPGQIRNGAGGTRPGTGTGGKGTGGTGAGGTGTGGAGGTSGSGGTGGTGSGGTP